MTKSWELAGMQNSLREEAQTAERSLWGQEARPGPMMHEGPTVILGTLRDSFHGIPHTRLMHRRDPFIPQVIDLLEGELI